MFILKGVVYGLTYLALGGINLLTGIGEVLARFPGQDHPVPKQTHRADCPAHKR